MKKLKVIVSIICFFFCVRALLYALDFKTQADVDNTGNWAYITPSAAGVFYDDFFLPESVILQSGITLRSNDPSVPRTLSANNNNSFFHFSDGLSDTYLTLDKLILKS
jgi:hypothetical protein